MKSAKRERFGQICLMLAVLVLLSSLILSAYFFLARPEQFRTHLPLRIFIYTLPVFAVILIGIGMNREKKMEEKSGKEILSEMLSVMLLLVTIFWYLWSPLQSNAIIRNYLNSSNLIASVSTWQVSDLKTQTLADIALPYSVVVVNEYGPTLQIAGSNSAIPGLFRAAGTENLRYVVYIYEVEVGETLSEKWQAYYKRGFDVSDPHPVKYIHIDWEVKILDLDTQTIIASTTISAEPPEYYRRPVESTVRVTPASTQLMDWLGFLNTP
ncbi:MAG: hypothetical protein JW726_04740 [Anaerolineales bacterium]|nr:hypothetical protein [Anaerolineales bacterium]